jgi:hypothetical protein
MASIGIIRINEVRFLESVVDDEMTTVEVPGRCWSREYDVDDIDHAVRIIEREGLTFAATGNDWAANPDGSYISDYATGERCAVTAHFDSFSDEDIIAVIERVG